MKRDMEYVRELLLKIEDGSKVRMESLLPEDATEEDLEKLRYHLGMLVDEAGFVRAIPAHTMRGKYWLDIDLTWRGHEFIETVRDPEVWRRTKEGAKKVGSWSVGLLAEMGKAYLKLVAKEKLGIDFT
jgi:hypothetical protein